MEYHEHMYLAGQQREIFPNCLTNIAHELRGNIDVMCTDLNAAPSLRHHVINLP